MANHHWITYRLLELAKKAVSARSPFILIDYESSISKRLLEQSFRVFI